MPDLAIAGAVILAALPLALIALGLLHLVHAKVKIMAALDILAELKGLIADLKALDFPAFVRDLKADVEANESALESELQVLIDDLKAVVAGVTAAKSGAPVEPQPEQPAA